MSEDNVVREAPRKKRRSLWWLWLLLMLAAFGGGIILGLKLNTLPLPTEVKDRLYPVLESYIPGSTAVRDAETAAATPAPTPAATPAPEPEPTAVPTEEPALPETLAPADETPAPEKALTPVETPAAEEKAAVLSIEETAETAKPETAEKKYLGIDAALDAALDYAKIARKDVEVEGVLRTKDEDSNSVYNVSFKSGDFHYEYVIDAFSGEVEGWLKSGFSGSDAATYAASFTGDAVSEAEAAATAEEAPAGTSAPETIPVTPAPEPTPKTGAQKAKTPAPSPKP